MFPYSHVAVPSQTGKLYRIIEETNGSVWDTLINSTCEILLNSNRTLHIINFTDGVPLTLFVDQDSVGSKSLSFSSALTIKWASAAAPVWSTAANKTDIVTFVPRRGILFGTFIKGF